MAIKRINITIDEGELDLARNSGETVSGYIRRLIRQDNRPGLVKLEVPPELYTVLDRSGVLHDLSSPELQTRILRVLVDYADEALQNSRQRLKAVALDLDE